MFTLKKVFFPIVLSLFISACAGGKNNNKLNSNGIEIPPGISSVKASDIAMEKFDNEIKKTRGVVTLHVVGRGIAPENAISKGQALILGQNAARADGYVKLAEKIYGVYVDSYRRTGRGMVDIEIVHQETQALLRGAEVLEYRRGENGIYEAFMRVRIIVDQNHALFPISS